MEPRSIRPTDIRANGRRETQRILPVFLFPTQCVRVAWATLLIPTLQAILSGSGDAALTDNPNLQSTGAVEVHSLIEMLARGAQALGSAMFLGRSGGKLYE